jgi:ABC-type glycerol-3-phosphate transport system permease component
LYNNARRKGIFTNTAIKVLIGAFTILYLIPVYWIVVTSFKPEARAMTWPPQFFPSRVVLDNYKVAFEQKSIFWYMQNSLVISIGSVLVSMAVGGIAAYSFTQMKWRNKTKKNLLLWIVSLKIMPPIAVAIPLFLIFVSLKMINTNAG